jgi:hypothetical protein
MRVPARRFVCGVFATLLSVTLLARPDVAEAQFRESLATGITRARPVSLVAPVRVQMTRSGEGTRCPGIRVRRVLAGIAIGGGLGLLVGHGTGALANIWRENEEMARRVRREHRRDGAAIGATIGGGVGITLRCSS